MPLNDPDVATATKKRRFRVWIKPRTDFCRVHVDGIDNSRWLLNMLGRSFVFRTFEPLGDAVGAVCTFDVALNPPLSLMAFRKLLVSIPEVQLVHQPA